MGDNLTDLYRERAEYADLESDCQQAKKFVRYGGFLWRWFNWIENVASRDRQDVDDEIRAIREARDD